ncbi:protein-tyrosine phosphatase-like protein [Tribonema minus]|uniref:protein-tyrosine-phosphatase n=1 Tax=Tribonema minus TaxID=303371 RepID=A0A835Z9L0_9STRA|nr:protein-tyrosine phosphatase-like protein [Tribonema minus]
MYVVAFVLTTAPARILKNSCWRTDDIPVPCSQHIINCTADIADNASPDFTWRRVPLEDHPAENIFRAFAPACAIIAAAREAGGATLVHCRKGMSRSATIALAFCVSHERMTLLEALRRLRAQRPSVSPNAGFMAQLLDLEHGVHGCTTVDLIKVRRALVWTCCFKCLCRRCH